MVASESAPGTIPVTPGDVLAGKYRVDRVLGVGGMGVVVAATHLQLDQKVALKFMLPQGLQHPGLVERFSREARAAVRLKSDHVARVLDVGTLASGSPYMVMEYLEGRDLGDVVESQGPMAVPAAVDCVLQACDAVAEAHALGIVHRDLKPRNLFLTGRNDGRALVKVLDFGISKHKTGSDLSLTRTTEIIGSPNYMSPEQLKSSKGADERSDIWALGVILYELLTGQVPFLAESVTQLTAMVLTENPRSIEQLRPDVPRALALVVACCLEKDPARRYPSVAHLAAALEPFAPPDTRDLAARIARIAGASSGTLPSHLGGSSGTRVAVAGSTAASWSGKTELAQGPGKKIAAVAAILAAVAMAGGIAVFLAVRPHRPRAADIQPAPSVAVGAATPSAEASATAPAAASTTVTLTPAPSAPASAVTATSATASAPGGAKPPARGTIAPAAATATTTAPTTEPPRYRTSW